MSEETHLINDLHVRRESAGGWEFVHLRDSDDGDTFMLGEDEILALHKYLGSLISEKRLHPLTFEGAVTGRYSGPFELAFEPRTETHTIHRAGILWLSEGFSKQTAKRVCAALNQCSRLTLGSTPPLPDDWRIPYPTSS